MKPLSKVVWSVTAILVFGSAGAWAQSIISAHSGLIHYAEGTVLLGTQPVESKFGTFPDVKENGVLKTEDGRVEVLLTPGVFLRLGENSGLRMVTNRLIDTRVEFLNGSAVVEVDEVLKDNNVTVAYKDTSIHFTKKGVYRFTSEPAQLRVYSGEARVEAGGNAIEVKEGRMLALDGSNESAKFDKDATDALDRWSRRRGEYVSMANISAAKQVSDSGMLWNSSGWRYNPYFGMFTFIPMRGGYYSPYGYRYWSPFDVYRVYMPRPVYSAPTQSAFGGGGGNYGYSSVGRTSGGYSGTMATSAPSVQAPTTTSAGASSAPVSRGGGSAGGTHR